MDFAYTAAEEQFRLELRKWLETNLPDGWLDGTSPASGPAFFSLLPNLLPESAASGGYAGSVCLCF